MSESPLDSQHPDYETLAPLVEAILKHGGGFDTFAEEMPKLFRQAFDEVIDAPRTGRLVLAELEKTEKTYVGTKVEILVRNHLQLPKGQILDLSVGGVEVDIKMTTGRSWMIPRESISRPAFLFRANEQTARCDIGLIVCRLEYMRQGNNQDRKKSISAANSKHIWWILFEHPYPGNFWQALPEHDRIAIMSAKSGSARLAALFEKVQRRPISRVQIEAVARQKDYMKRLRKNGGARDVLERKGIELLSGAYDQKRIETLGLGPVRSDEFVSISPDGGDLPNTVGLNEN